MRNLVLAAVLASLGLAITGCGGSGAAAVAKLGTTTAARPTTSVSSSNDNPAGAGGQASGGAGGAKTGAPFSVQGNVQQMTTFAACMRASGEPSFPDPNPQGVISVSLNRASPQFDQALRACRKDLPGGVPSPAQQAQDLSRALAFSACMRHSGEPNYPSPVDGAIRLLNIDTSSPQFKRASRICQKVGGGDRGKS